VPETSRVQPASDCGGYVGSETLKRGMTMKAQAYYSEDDMTIMIFPPNGTRAIAYLPILELSDCGADSALRKMNLRRNSAWIDDSWGKEANVHFVNKKTELSYPIFSLIICENLNRAYLKPISF
jgi:hypothetical protein